MNATTHRTLASLAKLRLSELQARFAETVGKPTRSPNKKFLLRRIGEALETREQEATAAPAPPAPTKIRLTKLSVAEFQAMYRDVICEDTSSTKSAYLVWKIRQAQNGRIRIGPVERSSTAEVGAVKVLPLRMTAAEVEQFDAAWKRLGFRSRTAMTKNAIETIAGSEIKTARSGADHACIQIFARVERGPVPCLCTTLALVARTPIAATRAGGRGVRRLQYVAGCDGAALR
ncbi:hypothetical protein WMF30_08815 [Sorangium sp. So ce134]